MKDECLAAPEKSLNIAESFLKRAYKKLGEAEGHMKQLNYSESISSSQGCIELSIKVMFLLFRTEYLKRHWFKDEGFEALLEKVPEKLRYLDFPRLFLYLKFWSGFYEIAKYATGSLESVLRSFSEGGKQSWLLDMRGNVGRSLKVCATT